FQKAAKIQRKTAVPREEDVTRPAAQSSRLSQGFSGLSGLGDLNLAALSAFFFAVMPKMNIGKPIPTIIALNRPIFFCLSNPPPINPSCTSSTSAKSPMSANGADRRIARVRAALGSGGEGGASLKIQLMRWRSQICFESPSSFA